MSVKISFQKTVAIIASIIILVALIFGVIARNSFSALSQSKSELLNAKLQLSEDLSYEYNNIYSYVDYDFAITELEQSECIFYAKCIDSELCFDCIKYNMNVIKTIKGDCEETSKEIILYQLLCFDFSKQGITFISPDNSLPLKIGEEYLIFANKKDYYEGYQKTLDKNEYALSLSGSFPTAIIVNEIQNEYINIHEVEKYSDIKNLYYMCYDKASLDNINEITSQVINHFLKTNRLN